MGLVSLVKVFVVVEKPKGMVLNWCMLFFLPKVEKIVVTPCYWDASVC